MGRRAKPIEMHMLEGNKSHLTKAEIEFRKKNEIKVGEQKLICPVYVKENKEAYKKWKEVIKIYDGITFISSGDNGLLGRYCMAFAEYIDLVEHRKNIQKIDEIDISKLSGMLDNELDVGLAKLIKKSNYLISVNGLLALDKSINAKMETLLKMEDRLFLNPLAKVKNIPKKEEKEEVNPLKEKGFDL